MSEYSIDCLRQAVLALCAFAGMTKLWEWLENSFSFKVRIKYRLSFSGSWTWAFYPRSQGVTLQRAKPCLGWLWFTLEPLVLHLEGGFLSLNSQQYLLNHAIFKGLLFFCSGALLYAAGSRSITGLSIIPKKIKITAFPWQPYGDTACQRDIAFACQQPLAG
jgi:hypothetical protein